MTVVWWIYAIANSLGKRGHPLILALQPRGYTSQIKCSGERTQVCIHVHVYTQMHTQNTRVLRGLTPFYNSIIHVYTQTCGVYIYICVYCDTRVGWTYIYTRIHVYTQMHTCIHTCIHCIYMCTHTHTRRRCSKDNNNAKATCGGGAARDTRASCRIVSQCALQRAHGSHCMVYDRTAERICSAQVCTCVRTGDMHKR